LEAGGSLIAGSGTLRRLWVGRTTSVIGDRMFAVGAIWIAWTLTHSSAGVACIILAESVPFLAWGALQHHTQLHVGTRALIGLDLLRAVLLTSLFLCLLHPTGDAAKACAVLLVASVAFSTAIFDPAFRSLIPELAPGEGRQAYASFDLGARLARIAGPLMAAAITWAGSAQLLIVADGATFLISALCLRRMPADSVNPGAGPVERPAAEGEGAPALSRILLTANGVGAFALIVWWLALPIAAGHHAHGATTYSLCIGMGAAGGVLANLLLSRSPDQHDPVALCSLGWATAGVCIGALASAPSPALLQGISFICGAALCAAALGFSYHAASLQLRRRNQLFQRDQLITRTAGACGAVASGLMLQSRPGAVITGTAGLLLLLAGWIWWHHPTG
jgi:DHA3 family macrolide efflux protein-like MFS transporter